MNIYKKDKLKYLQFLYLQLNKYKQNIKIKIRNRSMLDFIFKKEIIFNF
jgi:hypothetical protein